MLARRAIQGLFSRPFNFSRAFSVNNNDAQTQNSNFFDIRSKQLEGRSIYMDFGATTPLDFRALEAMLPFMTEMFGNPHSRSHHYGWESEKAIEKARANVASVINADHKEIIFTSGATESNNLALKGLADFYGKHSKKKHFVTTQFVSISQTGT
jgi:cysteine desulfurase